MSPPAKPGAYLTELLSDDGKHVVIRPLAYCSETDIAAYAEAKQFPIIPCNLCGSQEHLQRAAIKNMLQQWDRQTPGRLETIYRSLQHVVPSHLADTALFDFARLGYARGKGLPTRKWLVAEETQ